MAMGLDEVSQGDYVFINSGSGSNPNHGLLVVGWQALQDCQDALEAAPRYSTSTLPSTWGQAGGVLTVPYVVDFAGIPGSRLQRSIPRPFYCTRFDDPEGDPGRFGNYHGWTFYHLPNTVTISSQHFYIPPMWEW